MDYIARVGDETVYRMNTFFGIVDEDPVGRVGEGEGEEEIGFIRANREFAGACML